jgi:CheY-like chemotaxis protein
MRKQILIIDDELDICDVVCLALEEFGGWYTDSARSGQEGLEKANQRSWHAILLDVSMPDMDGFSVVSRLQEQASTRKIPVILLTAKTLDETDNFPSAGVAGVINKPFDPITIWQQVASILGWAV